MKRHPCPSGRRGGARVLAILGMLGTLTQATGCCTLIGLGVGAVVDHSKPSGEVPREEWAALPPDARVDLRSPDGTATRGRVVEVNAIRTDSAVVAVRTDSCVTRVPATQVASISRPGTSNGKIVGCFVGFMVDCLAVAVMAQALENTCFLCGEWGKTHP